MNITKGIKRIVIVASIFCGIAGFGLGLTADPQKTWPTEKMSAEAFIDTYQKGELKIKLKRRRNIVTTKLIFIALMTGIIGSGVPWLVYYGGTFIARGFKEKAS